MQKPKNQKLNQQNQLSQEQWNKTMKTLKDHLDYQKSLNTQNKG